MTHTHKKKNEVEDYRNYCFSVLVSIYTDFVAGDGGGILFMIEMMLFGDLTHLNIFHKIKMEIKEKLENQHFHFFVYHQTY